MGQKANPISLQAGIKRSWETKFAEKKKRDAGVIFYLDDQVKTFIKRFFYLKGFQTQKIKLSYQDDSIKIFVSLFSKLEADIKTKSINKGCVRLENSLGDRLVTDRKSPDLRILLKILNKFFRPSYKKVELIFNYGNKQLNPSAGDKIVLKKNILSLRRFRRQRFFKEGIESVLAASKNADFSIILTHFTIKFLKKEKKINRVLKFIQKFATLMVENVDYPISGVKVKIRGRLNGAGRARGRILVVGNVPCNTERKNLSYSSATTHNNNGSLGLKIWVVE